jgi:hypothetical protein
MLHIVSRAMRDENDRRGFKPIRLGYRHGDGVMTGYVQGESRGFHQLIPSGCLFNHSAPC